MKTYTLTSNRARGGRGPWGGSSTWAAQTENPAGLCEVGGASSKLYYATYFMFDEDTLAALRQKTILSITLSVKVLTGTIPGSQQTNRPVGYKYNNDLDVQGAWARANQDETDRGTYAVGFLRNASGGQTSADETVLLLDLSSGGVPKYGYVIGPSDTNVVSRVKLEPTAVLTVVTDEAGTSTVTYDANGGSGAPAAQTKESGTPLTLSSVEPVRSGYLFSNWNTASDGSGTDYQLGGQYIRDENVILYAQWTAITQSGLWVKGSDNVMHQGTVWVKGSDNNMHQCTVWVKGSDNAMHQGS